MTTANDASVRLMSAIAVGFSLYCCWCWPLLGYQGVFWVRRGARVFPDRGSARSRVLGLLASFYYHY